MVAYIISNGAAAYDYQVTTFHTFWGLNALKKRRKNLLNRVLNLYLYSS